ncbi:MAG: MBL fold metallo-hydrolase [Gammaproteobacteria bacterium]|jgi:phosphoribosyl 1,2-cyclic phosphodiesterase|nr:MBL fold metallo-hydrolase [Gammaproteobacteria bacterium]
MRFASLGSGSRGNATVIEAGSTRLLIDCGYALAELERRLAVLGVGAEGLDAVVVTHEHADHLRGVGVLARRWGVPVWMTPGTRRAAAALGELPDLRLFDSHGPAFAIGEIELRPVAVPHDAAEPCQFVLRASGRCLAILTDCGSVTPHVVGSLRAVDALLLELNHDAHMLARGPYPPALRARVGGPLGHLSNAQAADLLSRLDLDRLGRVVAGHLSEKNNRPDLVMDALRGVSRDLEPRVTVLTQDDTSAWLAV